ncbi:MAG: DUF2330 domain-containing protein [bacterium]
MPRASRAWHAPRAWREDRGAIHRRRVRHPHPSAQQSDGLERWLRESGHRIPTGRNAILGSYLKQNMRFFVAKVNLSEQAKLGFHYLRPPRVAYESPKFMPSRSASAP